MIKHISDYDELLNILRPVSNEESLLLYAVDFARKHHTGQVRKSGEEYIIHPLNVAIILLNMNLDDATIIAGILHDIIEDTDITYEDVEREFGSTVAFLVDGVTKIGKISYQAGGVNASVQADSFRKMVISMTRDIRVLLIKLADRLHNMHTLQYLSEEKQQRIAGETLDIYTPLAHRLGIAWVKWELEDMAFRILHKEEYYSIQEQVKLKRPERENFISLVCNTLENAMDEAGIKGDVMGRPKHFYSIYNKMKKKGTDVAEMYDLFAVRILVDSLADCYGSLGIIHHLWHPIPSRIKDYIALPKSNMYQSLHTTVVGPEGNVVEIQIRTFEMHKIAEEGVAAHWQYKEGEQKKSSNFDMQINQLRQLVDQHESSESSDFMNMLKTDYLSDQIYIFTPKGDVVELPDGATVLDFAYTIHTEVGDKCTGATVEGRILPIHAKLQNGQKIVLLTSNNQKPKKEWLNHVVTSRAKSKIKNYLSKVHKEKKIETGRTLLEREFALNKTNPNLLYKNENHQQQLLKAVGYGHLSEMYVMLCDGKLTAREVWNKYLGVNKELGKQKEAEKKLEEAKADAEILQSSVGTKQTTKKKSKKTNKSPLTVLGISHMVTKMAKCCSPMQGDSIIGYISSGKGIIIHRVDCTLLKNAKDQNRFISVEWDEKNHYNSEVKMDLEINVNSVGLVGAIGNLMKDNGVNIVSINLTPMQDSGTSKLSMVLDIPNRATQDKIRQSLTSSIKHVIRIL